MFLITFSIVSDLDAQIVVETVNECQCQFPVRYISLLKAVLLMYCNVLFKVKLCNI